MRFANLLLSAALGCLGVTAQVPEQQIPVEITHGKIALTGRILLSIEGSMNKAKMTWDVSIRNTSDHKVYKVAFCVKAFGASGEIKRTDKGGEKGCIFQPWKRLWEPGTSLTIKRKTNVKFSEDRTTVRVTKFTVTIAELVEGVPNVRTLDHGCPAVWPFAIQAFAYKKFRPTLLSKDNHTATLFRRRDSR
jgi:hypothetical protein